MDRNRQKQSETDKKDRNEHKLTKVYGNKQKRGRNGQNVSEIDFKKNKNK